MKTFRYITLLLPILTASVSSTAVNASDEFSGWYVRPFTGLNQLASQDADTSGVGGLDGTAKLDLDPGFTAGVNLGYRFNSRWSGELSWEYRRNDTKKVGVAAGRTFNDGDYASNIIHINGAWHLAPASQWDPYIGAGVSWAQEIDLDINSDQSFSSDSDTGYQLFAGVNYKVGEQWAINAELRRGSITGIELQGEGSPGTVKNLDYEPTTFQLGMSYRF